MWRETIAGRAEAPVCAFDAAGLDWNHSSFTLSSLPLVRSWYVRHLRDWTFLFSDTTDAHALEAS